MAKHPIQAPVGPYLKSGELHKAGGNSLWLGAVFHQFMLLILIQVFTCLDFYQELDCFLIKQGIFQQLETM